MVMLHSTPTWLPILAASLNTLTALVWGTLAFSYCRCHGTSRPSSSVLRLFRLLGYLFASYYAAKLVIGVLEMSAQSGPWYDSACIFAELSSIILLPVMRHIVQLGTLGAPRPSRGWLAFNYGLGLVACVVGFWYPLTGSLSTMDWYLLLMASLILWDLVRLARERRRPILMADWKFRGYLVFAVIMFGAIMVLLLTESASGIQAKQSLLWVLAHNVVGLASAAPFAMRILGEMVRGLLLNGLRLGVALGGYWLLLLVVPREANVAVHMLLSLLAAVTLVIVLGPGSRSLSDLVDFLLLRNRHRWRGQLRSMVRGLPAEAGVEASCRQAADAVTEILGVRGAAILLTDGLPGDGSRVVSSGRIDIEPLVEAWTTADRGDLLPEGMYDLVWLDDLQLQFALHDAKVTWVGPIRSPNRSWGYLFVAAGLFGSAAAHAKLELLADLVRELALVLDTADSLVRVRRAERDLAQSEKLAALGESAARIAHEIRNPVTAARSLAQLMAEEPNSPFNAEHGQLVVQELDRVESRMRSMLQLAKQETYRFEPMCLADAVRQTMEELEAPIQDIEVHLQMDCDDTVLADAEGVRQVLVNLISNSVDALQGALRRRLDISLRSSASGVALRVADSGRGVPEELLPKLFEPFVTSKAQGAGLGLAIAKRIVEAHGGRIEVAPVPEGGTEFCVQLPVHGPATAGGVLP